MLIKLIFPPLNNINLFCTGTYYMNRHGVQSSSRLSIGKGSDGVAIFDLDGDNKKDIIATSSMDNTVTIFFGK